MLHVSEERVTVVKVSIPFREELHSDSLPQRDFRARVLNGFHPFQGRAPFGLMNSAMMPQPGVYVSIPFREELHSDIQTTSNGTSCTTSRFHPFQGRAPFGQEIEKETQTLKLNAFPSLSGKSSIRTFLDQSLSGATFWIVSIPFREELHSDKQIDTSKSIVYEFRVSIPFREELHSDSARTAGFTLSSGFPSLSGKSSIRTFFTDPNGNIIQYVVSIPFREELDSDLRR